MPHGLFRGMVAELNVRWRGHNDTVNMKAHAKLLGFDILALTEIVEEAASLKTSFLPRITPAPNPLSMGTKLPSPAVSEASTDDSMLLLSRLHVELQSIRDLTPLHAYLKSSRRHWDLCSVKITDEAVWQRLFNGNPISSIDIVQMEWYESSPPYRPNRHQLNLLASQGIYLEICLDKLLLTPTGVSANFFRNVALVCRHMPKSYILVSTGAASPLYLRSPSDLHALVATLFGAEPARRIVYENPRNVLERAEARKAAGRCGLIAA